MNLVKATLAMVSSWVRDFYVIVLSILSDDPNPIICIRGVDASINAATTYKLLGVPNVSNTMYIDKAWEMDIWWLRDTLIMDGNKNHIYWPINEGLRSPILLLMLRGG